MWAGGLSKQKAIVVTSTGNSALIGVALVIHPLPRERGASRTSEVFEGETRS